MYLLCMWRTSATHVPAVYVAYLSYPSRVDCSPQMVVYESARAMVNLRNVTARELQPAVSGSQWPCISAVSSVR